MTYRPLTMPFVLYKHGGWRLRNELGIRLREWAGPELVWNPFLSPGGFVTRAEMKRREKGDREVRRREKKAQRGEWRGWRVMGRMMGRLGMD